jgi:hypothetical protein
LTTYLFVLESLSAGDSDPHIDIDLITDKSVSDSLDKFIALSRAR